MGSSRGVARVRRDALSARVTCPLCRGLLREATAITQCLHTFCRECIMEKINDDDVDSCPVCNIDLGCDPEEKLRPDHNLQDIRNKLFPIKKRKVDSPKDPTTFPPKRKQRSLSSLVVDTPSVAMRTGLTGKRTKAKRRAAASRGTIPGNNGTMKLPAKAEDRDQKTEKSSAPKSTKVATTAKKIESRDQKKIEKTESRDQKKIEKTESRDQKKIEKTESRDQKKIEKTESRDQKKIEKTSVQKSTKAATAASKKQRNTDVEISSKPSSEDRKKGKTTDKEELQKPSNRSVYAASKTKAPRSTPKIRSATEEQIKNKEGSATEEQIKNKEGELPIGKDKTENKVVIPGTRVEEHSNEPIIKEENIGSSSEPAPSTEKAKIEDGSNQGLSGSASILHDPKATPIWFSLVSLPNQKGGPQLPQLSNLYLRIKDGSLHISSVQRYITKKLDLGDENEVEIIFHDEPICPSSTMHALLELWLRREPHGRVPLPPGAPADQFVMALGYRRRHCPDSVPGTAAVPPDNSCKVEATAVEAA